MSDVFGTSYSDLYDLMYQEKDYAQECDRVEDIFERFGTRPVKRVLDLGCGSGNHALPLAARDYEVCGVDRSEAMLKHARAKASTQGSDVRFELADLRDIDLGEHFDAILMMFAVLGYQRTNQDVEAALRAARKHLGMGALLVGDVWHGPAVISIQPETRVRVFETGQRTVLKTSSGLLKPNDHLCRVEMEVWGLEGGRLLGRAREKHDMRFFFPQELAAFFDATGFEMIRLAAFDDLDRDPDLSTWNVLFVARAV